MAILWIGKELEGEYIGTNTLFVGSPTVQADEIKNILQCNDINQIYFGAGGCTDLNFDVIKHFISEKYIIMAEISIDKLTTIPDKYKNKLEFMVVINNKNFSILKSMDSNMIHIKLQSVDTIPNYLAVVSLVTFIKTDAALLNDKKTRYASDIVLR